MTWVLLILFSSSVHASPENDRIYQLDTLAWLKATDNMDGVFSDFLEDQYTQFFSGQGRFLIKRLKGLSEILADSKAKPSELLQQPEILRKIAQKYGVEGLLRTRVTKEGDSYHFIIEWVYAPKGDVLASVDFRYIDEGTEAGIKNGLLGKSIEKGLTDLISKLPFLGSITGVEGDTITVSLGHNVDMKPGQIVTLYTLQAVKRHPVLRTVEEWAWQPVGRAQIDQVESTLSFAKIISLEPNMSVLRHQKIREILAAPVKGEAGPAAETGPELPRSGWVAGSAGAGSYSREVGLASGSGKGGSGLLGQFDLESQVWLNSRYLVQGSLGGSIFKYSPTDLTTGVPNAASYSGTETRLRLAVGYSLFPMKTLYDPIVWIHAGYRYGLIALPTNTSDRTAKSDLGSVILGIGGEFPVYGGWLAQIGMDLGVIRSGTADNLGFGVADPTSDLTFRAAAGHRMNERLYFRLGFTLHSESFGFTSGQSLTQKSFSISPSFMYYF